MCITIQHRDYSNNFLTKLIVLVTIDFRNGGDFMSDVDIAKRKQAEKLAYAINSIEGVPVPDEVKSISARWVQGEISADEMKQELIKMFMVQQ